MDRGMRSFDFGDYVTLCTNSGVIRTESDTDEPLHSLDLRGRRNFYEMRLRKIQAQIDDVKDEYAGYRVQTLKRLSIISSHPSVQRRCRQRRQLLADRDSLEATLRLIDGLLEKHIIHTESGVAAATASDGSLAALTTEQNILEASGDDIKYESAGASHNSQQGQHNLLMMGDFLSRPVEIYRYRVTAGSHFELALPIWDLFTSEPSVRAKLRNYAFLRADMQVRISVSGVPQHYGRILASYQPFPTENENLVNLFAQHAIYVDTRPNVLNYLSQACGATSINVNENLPVELTCPYISTKPMHRLFNTSSAVLAANTSYSDLLDAGSLFLWSLNYPRAVSDSPTPIYIQVYAWMTNVEIGTSTATQIAITTESGNGDERLVGPVEALASRVFSASMWLSRVPSIAPFARASAMAASALGGVSAIFGWSKPVLIKAPKYVKNEPFQNGALTIGFDTAKRIVLDPKQELTVDPGALGCTEDEMSISHICQRRSFLKTFEWGSTDAPLASPIYRCRVHPNLVTSYADTGVSYVQPTAMAFASEPFLYWRGDIIFRFEIVCSNFHRGKLAVFYEPNLNQSALINADVSLNKQYMRIVDIQQTQTFEVCVNWASYRAWLLNTTAAGAIVNTDFMSSATQSVGYANGYLAVVPFTELQSPDSSAIECNVYVYSRNMQFNQLSENNMPNERKILTESGSAEATRPVSCVELNESSASTQHISEEHFGEQPVSFRALMRRYVTTNSLTLAADATAGTKAVAVYDNIYPQNSLPYGATSRTYYDLFNHLRYAYVGVRGGYRVRVRPTSLLVSSPLFQGRFTLEGPTQSLVTPVAQIIISAPDAWATLGGTCMFVPMTNGGLEVELPLYTNNLFLLSFNPTFDDGGSNDVMNRLWSKSYIISVDTSGAWLAGTVTLEKAAAEDFSFMRFQGAPIYSANTPS